MRSKRKDPLRHIGFVKGNQKIISFVGYKSRGKKKESPFYIVQCNNCNHNYESSFYNLGDSRRTGVTCRKCCNKDCKKYNRMSASDAQVSIVFSNYKSRAKSKGWEFNLSREEFKGLIKSNYHYCGQKPNRIRLDRVKGKRDNSVSALTNGIDRIDSSKGYTKNNTLSCCEDCNKAKRNLSYIQFIELIKSIHNHLKL